MTTAPAEQRSDRLLTIGAVCRRLKEEFPDISISKIRYLEDQGLVTPKRTQGRYRMFSDDDLERLETILRLQRDEFLPLRVIRQELTSAGAKGRRRRRSTGIAGDDDQLTLEELCERAEVEPGFVRELEEYGFLAATIGPRTSGRERGDRRYAEDDVDVAAACAKLARYGVSPRHLRTFRTTAERQSGLLEQVLAPSLRSRSPERRSAGLEDLRTLAELTQELSQLLFWRSVRAVAAR